MADGTQPQTQQTQNSTAATPAKKALKLTFPNDSAFQKDLRARVDAYFVENNLTKGATPFMWAKTVFWIALAFGALFTAALAPLPVPAALALWLVAGFGFAGIGFNVAHDATHGATSTNKTVNTVCSWAFDVIGVASSNWRIAHNLLHHTYTNVPEVDTDIEPGPFLRFQPYAKFYPWHRFQAVYCWALYCLTSLLWVWHKDYYQGMQPHPRTGARTSGKEWAVIFLGKALHIGAFLVVPIVFGPHHWYVPVIGYLMLHALAGITLAIVFQLAHVVEGVRFPRPEEGKLPRGWMEHELLTTANFGNSWICNFITGGLDHQIEHHLFPTICHVHYPKLSPIVKKCAEDHGIPYLYSGTFLQAVASHARVMNRLGHNLELDSLAAPVARDAANADAALAAAA